MNIHEYQAKEILKEYGAPVTEGVVISHTNDLEKQLSVIKTSKIVITAQIHAGGRGKAGE